MGKHYGLAFALHTAVIRGDSDAIALAAQALARAPDPPGTITDRTAKHAATIRQAAADVAASKTIVAAATSTALILNACGQCHLALDAKPSFTLRPESELGGIVGHMLAHRRAADQMFQGLATPSNALWREGTRAFASAPLHAGDLPVNQADRKWLTQTEERMHRLSTDAAQATEPRARANYYGLLLGGCADCHGRSARWGPPPHGF
jgi:cytochrome c553